MTTLSMQYSFTNEWFKVVEPLWLNFIPQINPTKILEIGSYEGRSTCFLIDLLSKKKEIEIHCVDTWKGGVEHSAVDMSLVEMRFKKNIEIAKKNSLNKFSCNIHKGFSDLILSNLFVNGYAQYFDLIYIDGSHLAPDVICDAILSFKLLKVGGVIIFDDYLWSENCSEEKDIIRSPKLAIDSFCNIYCRKINIFSAPLLQFYIQKLSN